MRMSVILWLMGVCLLARGSLSSTGEAVRTCSRWRQGVNEQSQDVCCDICNSGHHRVQLCGSDPQRLCTPCKPGTFTEDPTKYRCTRCTQCVGAQVLVKDCTASRDTVCGCSKGLRCGNDKCSFCITECDRGQEPAEKRSCRSCPHGTFNDQIHQTCKPWSGCPGGYIVAKGDVINDVKCANVSVALVNKPKSKDHTVPAWPLILCLISIGMVLIILSTVVSIKLIKKKKSTKTLIITPPPIIRTPTDDPRTLIAVECSFHEALQEQGSSSTLASKDSTSALIG
ncbi:tumor necrosis factor receptor superfamily member 9a [Genypterus blacodes]|uniref:tumor necrosis factor receptor superfamily member 9a n=1 Tax=Genypterus blacodes TaxID=154954 RepID=UPI003F7720FD